MNPQLTEELRSSMEQFTEHVVMPQGLARSAYLRWRKRRVMTRAAAAAAAAAVVAGAAVAITAGAGDSGNAQAQDAAYVALRTPSRRSAGATTSPSVARPRPASTPARPPRAFPGAPPWPGTPATGSTRSNTRAQDVRSSASRSPESQAACRC